MFSTVSHYVYTIEEDDKFEGTSLLNTSGLGAHKVWAVVTEQSEDYTSATVQVHWQVGEEASTVILLRDGEMVKKFTPNKTGYEQTFDMADMGTGDFNVTYTVVADNGTPVATSVSGNMGQLPEIADVVAESSMVVSFNDELSPFSWVAGTQSEASFEDGPFENVKSLQSERSKGYATFDKDLSTQTKLALGFWFKVNGSVSSDPNIISNKDWDSGRNKGFTVAVKSSGIKLNIGDGSDRADSSWLSYTKDQWIYVAAAIDLEKETMTLYVSDPEQGFQSSTVSTEGVDSIGSDYPLNIGEGGDGEYNVGRTLDFNMADLIVLEGREVSQLDIRALANADKPLNEYVDDIPDVSDVLDKSLMVMSFNGYISPLSWVAGTQSEASFEDGPFDSAKALNTERSLGYATYNQSLSGVTNLSFGCWLKINGNVESDPNIISNKDWNHGYYKGFTVAAKSSGIKLNIGDGSNRADSGWLPYTKDQWIYLAVSMDLDNKNMTLYVVDPVNGFQSSSVSTGDVSSLASDYPINIGEGGDGDYNTGCSINFSMADLLVMMGSEMTSSDVKALANAYKPLGEY